MTLSELLVLAKEYLHRDSGLPGEPEDYKITKDLQYRLSKAYTRLVNSSADVDDKTIYLLIESWLMMNPTRSSLQWDTQAFKKFMSGD